MRYQEKFGTGWPKDAGGAYVPKELGMTFVSLTEGRDVDALYCSSEPAGHHLFEWHVLAVIGEGVVEVQGSGPSFTMENEARDPADLPATTLKVARVGRLLEVVDGVKLASTRPRWEGQKGLDEGDEWLSTWSIDLFGDPVTLPVKGDEDNDGQRAVVEGLIRAILNHLYGRTPKP